MVSQHPESHEEADPFDGLTDEQVLARAARALKKVNSYPVGSVQRSMQWSVYEQAKAELDLRLCAHIVRKIQEHHRKQN